MLTRLVVVFAIAYGLSAIALSAHIIIDQQAVRQHLWLALANRPQRPFTTVADARTAAAQFTSELNAAFPRNPCRPSAPAFVMTKMRPKRHRACTVFILPHGRRLYVQAYDTQGHPMDNVFERLHPPPRHL